MLIRVKVFPDSKKEEVIEKTPVSFVVKVRASAERNAANMRMRALLAAHLGMAPARLRIVSGHHAPGKTVEVRGGQGSD